LPHFAKIEILCCCSFSRRFPDRGSIEVHLRKIEATVVDRSAKPFEGLTAADFESVHHAFCDLMRENGNVLIDAAALRGPLGPRPVIRPATTTWA